MLLKVNAWRRRTVNNFLRLCLTNSFFRFVAALFDIFSILRLHTGAWMSRKCFSLVMPADRSSNLQLDSRSCSRIRPCQSTDRNEASCSSLLLSLLLKCRRAGMRSKCESARTSCSPSLFPLPLSNPPFLTAKNCPLSFCSHVAHEEETGKQSQPSQGWTVATDQLLSLKSQMTRSWSSGYWGLKADIRSSLCLFINFATGKERGGERRRK